MEASVTTQFVILALHQENGRIMIDNLHIRYALVGSVLMDFLEKEEISLKNKRLIHTFIKTGENVHDKLSEIIERSKKPRRISYWLHRLSMKSRFIFRETTGSLINKGIIRHERRLFLNLFPYNRYFINERGVRSGIIDGIRDVLLHDKSANGRQIKLIGLITASRAWHIFVREKGERRLIRRKCQEFMKANEVNSDIDQVIREIQAAIASSITAAAVATG